MIKTVINCKYFTIMFITHFRYLCPKYYQKDADIHEHVLLRLFIHLYVRHSVILKVCQSS